MTWRELRLLNQIGGFHSRKGTFMCSMYLATQRVCSRSGNTNDTAEHNHKSQHTKQRSSDTKFHCQHTTKDRKCCGFHRH